MSMSKAKKLAEAHWEFIEECLSRFSEEQNGFDFELKMENMRWSFMHGFTHGFKHGVEEK